MTPKQPSRGYVDAWDVESLSEPGKTYTVSKRKDGAFACSCAAWKFAHAPKPDCKHIRALRSDITLAPTVLTAKLVAISFDGVVVARVPQAQASVLRANLSGIIRDSQPTTIVSSEFRIKRKFRFED